jgi:hypothetical protein
MSRWKECWRWIYYLHISQSACPRSSETRPSHSVKKTQDLFQSQCSYNGSTNCPASFAPHVSIPEHRSGNHGHADFQSTVQNGQSPLFLLPAELRVKVWTLAFGNNIIDVDIHHRRLRFTIYDDKTARRNQTSTYPLNSQLTCQQMLYETSHELIATSSFHFDSPKTFHKFILTKPDVVPKVPHLGIRCCATARLNRPAQKVNMPEWAKVLTPSYISRFTSLQTVVLTLAFMSLLKFPNAALVRQRDLSGSQMWTQKRLPDIIRAFQQLKLQQGTTGVAEIITDWKIGKHRRAFERVVRRALKRHQGMRYPKWGAQVEFEGLQPAKRRRR